MKEQGQVKELGAAYRALAFFVRFGGYRFGEFITTCVLLFYFVRNRSTIATSMAFYEQLFPNASRLKRFWLAWSQFWNFSMLMLDRLLLSLGLADKFQLTHEGLDQLQKNRDDKSPAILWIAHAGNWEIASHFLTDFGFKLNVIAGKREGEGIAAEQKEGMKEAGINLVIVEEESNLDSVQLIKRLKEGEFVAISGDRIFHPAQKTVQVDFLGRIATVPAGPYVLSLLSGANIYPVFGFRTGAFKYKFKAYPPKSVQRTKRTEREQSLNKAAEACFLDLEHFVKKYPHQWFNFFDFWDSKG